jgi:hypothetical protein
MDWTHLNLASQGLQFGIMEVCKLGFMEINSLCLAILVLVNL